MRSSLSLAIALLPISQALPSTEKRQSVDVALAASRAQQIKDAFVFSWDGYYKYAFPNDELHPVSNTFSNSRNGWGASAVDALSTAIVMGEKKIVNEILDHIATIDYSQSYQNESVSLFETTIRYLGGMLSGYDFLSGPRASLANKKSNVKALLTQAEKLANTLSFAFNTPSGIPSNNLYINGVQATDGSTTNGIATIGTLVLEWTRLSDLTGNPVYGRLAQQGEAYLLDPSYAPSIEQPYPGLLGTNVNLTNGVFVDNSGGWVGGDDSFYEYLIKMYVYDSTRFGAYKDRWLLAVESSIAHFAESPIPRPDVTYLAAWNGQQPQNYSEHLACFDGGNWILGGSALGRDDILDYGLRLVGGCRETYTATATGIGPEVFSWNTSTIPQDEMVFYEDNGFYITNSLYDLRPEVIESYYYAYQVTGDTRYQQWAWEAFLAINASCRAGSGYSEISDVNAPGGGTKNDFQESFWFAEVMKYSYLIQAPNQDWDVKPSGKNTWVFNTEAHPFQVAHVSYGNAVPA